MPAAQSSSSKPGNGAETAKHGAGGNLPGEKIVKAPRARAARVSAPVNVDKQCGVELPKGGLCGRSLTCKTHSMGAKRAVTGRSQTFDALLLAHNQQKQAKQALKAALGGGNTSNTGPGPRGGRGNAKITTTAAESAKSATAAASASSSSLANGAGNHSHVGGSASEDFDEEPLTEQEEIQQVLSGVMRAQPMPLSRRVIIGARPRNRYLRSRELFFQALSRIPALGADGGAAAAASGALGSAMAATGALLGRALLYETSTGSQVARMSRIQARRIVYAQAQVKAQAAARARAAAAASAAAENSNRESRMANNVSGNLNNNFG